MTILSRNIVMISAFAFVLVLGLLYSSSTPGFPVITGWPIARLTIVEVYHKMCNISLNPGFNYFSAPCFGDEVAISTALEEFYQNLTNSSNMTVCSYKFRSIHAYDSTDSLDHWKSYNPCLPSYVVQDMAILDDKKGYAIYMNLSARLEYGSDVSIPNYVPLFADWNFVGYPSNDTTGNRSVGVSIGSINQSYLAIYSYSAGKWLFYNDSIHNFSFFEPFHPYWMRMLENATWVIDW
ncbi:MAG: hypothetical protein V1837_02725 [Candidatus Woesearchaeota archaeon]